MTIQSPTCAVWQCCPAMALSSGLPLSDSVLLVKWTSHNDECFFCRKRIEKRNFEPHQKILELNIETDEINEEDLPEDIRILRNRNLFTSFRTLRLWLNINSCTVIRYLTCYGFIGFGLYTVKHTTFRIQIRH